ncbi:M48 family metallopeptidase [Hymenobacter crusticola]|nr:M48 family metallopeptidase [Hymenobacter crusticola]
MTSTLYPPSPAVLPAGFDRPNLRYRWMIAAMMTSILLFILLYLALLAAALWLVYFTLTMRLPTYTMWTALFHLGCVVAAAMVVVFLVKFFFKATHKEQDGQLRLAPEAQPELFAFIQQLCAESGAPMPKNIYIDAQVSASVSYDNTLRSLFLPTQKNLLIGLGLVNGLNLTEFKAVLAHEFGHFAQRTMRLGSYAYTASRIIHDMVYERDAWDETLSKWCQLDIRVSIVAWLMTTVVWAIRKVLELAFQGIHLVNASLSREMEFEADRMAVRMAGSDAICQALYQLGPVSTALQQAMGQLSTALEHKLATNDLFYHQTLCLRESLAERLTSTLPSSEGPKRLFKPDEVQVVEMYASHPADYLREQRAQALEVLGPVDERSPWLLFNNPDELRQSVTHIIYSGADTQLGTTLLPAQEIEEFLAAERHELTYHPQYAGTYDTRLLTLLDPSTFAELAETTTLPIDNLVEAHQALFGPELQARTDAAKTRHADLQRLALIQGKRTKESHFTVQGITYKVAEAASVTERLTQEKQQHTAWLATFDRQVVALHWHLSASNAPQRAAWLARYQVQYVIQQALETILQLLNDMRESIQEIFKKGQLTEREVGTFNILFRKRLDSFDAALQPLRVTELLPLVHLASYKTLYDFVMHSYEMPHVVLLSNNSLSDFLGVLDGSSERLQRLYFKNLGALLCLQEELVASAECQPKPTPTAELSLVKD